jgi:hypothetical protein
MRQLKLPIVTAILALLVPVLAATPALAGATLFGGVTQYQHDVAEYWQLGYHGGLRFTVPILSFLEIGGQFTYNRNSFDWDEFRADTPSWPDDQEWDMHTTIAELLGIARLNAPGGKLYGVAGIGFARVGGGNATDEDHFEDYNRFVAAIGGGVDLGQVEIIGMYHVLSWGSDVELDWEAYQDYFDFATLSLGVDF